ncbi:MAG: TldD/PmbA family protein [Clostridia bacterium]|nr:TldD/PmbA family protein [Clostridia bacterium]
MPFSNYLDSKRADCRELVEALGQYYDYVSILGTDVRATVYRADRKMSMVREGSGECGFVVKMHSGRSFYEYSCDSIEGDKKALAAKIAGSVKVAAELTDRQIRTREVADLPMKQDFSRENDFADYTDSYLLGVCKKISDDLAAKDEKVLNAIGMVQPFTVSKLFVTKNRELAQYYGWVNAFALVIYNDGKMVEARHIEGAARISEAVEKTLASLDKVIDLARHLTKATPIKPGVYDVITDSSITGLIAHEAFGHGVEMDQFVKDRAMAKHCVGQYVASPITNMHDGAAATHSVASYFFDDDGVLAHDTQIIKDGILVAGLSDLASATQLGTEPTGNGRRDNYTRKAYSRMTNTFFSPGTDKLEDMIASIKHGYMLFETNNGMEDPKNWQIQCTAEYGIEIVDGKLTENYVSPVVMSGSVPELLKSISMISDNFEVIGSGYCGKGYKEWVRVSDGGPNLKVRVKLG